MKLFIGSIVLGVASSFGMLQYSCSTTANETRSVKTNAGQNSQTPTPEDRNNNAQGPIPYTGRDGSPERGEWGGTGIAMVINANGVRIELDCATATIDRPIDTGHDGPFDLTGRLMPETPGPARDDRPPAVVEARFTGRIDGTRMSLSIKPASGNGGGDFSLGKNVVGRLRKCR